MEKISFSDVIGLGGIAFATVLLVLDKAGKLKGGLLFGLLCLAGAMTLFIAVGNSWVMDAPPKWKLWRGAIAVCFVAFTYSGLAIVISGGSEKSGPTSSTEARPEDKQPRTDASKPPDAPIKTKPENHAPPKEHETKGSDVTLDIGKSLNPKYAFETRLILTNHNSLPITRVTYTCELYDGKTGPCPVFAAVEAPVVDLPSGQSASIYCDMVMAEAYGERMGTPVVQIWVSYEYKRQEKKGFRFFIKRDENGAYVWFPLGSAEELKPPKL